LVTWTFVTVHVPFGPKVPESVVVGGVEVNLTGPNGVLAPSGLPPELASESGELSDAMGESWCARAPYSVDVVADLAPKGEWVVPCWSYDPVTVEAAARRGLTLFARPCWYEVSRGYSELFVDAVVPCAAPCEVESASGSVPLVPTFPLRDAGGERNDLVGRIREAVSKAERAGREPVFCVYLNPYTRDDVLEAARVVAELRDEFGGPARLRDCARVVKRESDGRVALSAVGSLQWEAMRFHDLYYMTLDSGLDARKHGFACALRAAMALQLAPLVRPPVSRAEQYSHAYDEDVPVPAMMFDELSIAALLRGLVRIGERSPDPYHHLVRDLEAAVRTAVVPFPSPEPGG